MSTGSKVGAGHDSSCWSMRDGLSALVDGEDPGMDREVLDTHLGRCADCRNFAERSEDQARRLRIRKAEPVPNTTEAILAAIAAGPAPRPGGHVPFRVLAAASVAVALLAGAAFAGGRLIGRSGGSGLASVTQVAGSDQQNPRYPGATVLPVIYHEPDVTMTNTSGQPYNLTSQPAGRVTLLYFGYTHCPDVCPINMALLAQTFHRLPAADRARVDVVFITTDPTRDTPSVMRAWLDNFSASFIGLNGTQDQIHQAEHNIGVPLSYADTPDGTTNASSPSIGSGTSGAAAATAAVTGGNYQVVHNGATLIYTPDGIAHLQVDDTERPAYLVTTLEHLLARGYQGR